MRKINIIIYLSCYLLIPSSVLGQQGPILRGYEFQVNFWQSYGTIGSDGATNPPDPSWQIAVERSIDNQPDDLLDNTPNAVNENMYNYWLSTFNNGWHPVQNIQVYSGTENISTGSAYFDYEIMSYENDCTSLSQYNVGVPSCNGADDENMNYVEGIYEYTLNTEPGVWNISDEIFVDALGDSRVRFITVWRHRDGDDFIPHNFGSLDHNQSYGHTNFCGTVENAPTVSYANSWTPSDNANFNDLPDVTYRFVLHQKRFVHFSFFPSGSLGKMHLIQRGGSSPTYLTNLTGVGELEQTLPAGTYDLVFEGTGGQDIGKFEFYIWTVCSDENVTLSGSVLARHTETDGTIHSSEKIFFSSRPMAVYDSGAEVNLEAGFDMEPGTALLAIVDGCGVTDINGNDYRTVHIGDQEWMGENLRTTQFNDGTPIPQLASDMDWSGANSPGWCWPGNDMSKDSLLGKLYNGYVIDSVVAGKNVCPTGWHVPNDTDWIELRDFLGGEFIAGGKMKTIGTDHWQSPNSGAKNAFGFTGYPTGFRSLDGFFFPMNESAQYWSQTPQGSNYRFWKLNHTSETLSQESFLLKGGFSIRCVKD